MAITNAQQYKQLVNPPMEGKKRPGYRGVGGYRGGPGGSGGGKGKEAPGSKGSGFEGGQNVGRDSDLDRAREVYQANQTLKLLAEDKAQEPYETLIVKDSGLPGLGGMLLDAFKGPRQFMLNKNVDYFRGLKSRGRLNDPRYSANAQGYKNYMRDRMAGKIDAAGNPIMSGDDNDSNTILPVDTTFNMGSGDTDQGTDTTEEDEGLFRRFRADGGIMNSDVVGGEFDFESARQMYGLGKLVKKVTRTVKKIAKSPIGKAALLYTAGFGIPGTNFGGLLGTAKGSMFGAREGIFGTFGPKSALQKLGLAKSVADAGAAATRTGPFANLGIGSAILGVSALAGFLTPQEEEEAQQISDETGIDIAEIRANPNKYLARRFVADGGMMRLGYQEGSKEPVAKKTMPLLDMGGKEKDYRETGGFVDMGRMERADDVPARLSKNEFVFTADAVRNAGDGSVDKGAEVMYNMMKNLEAGGEVSEESQGMDGARKMFQTAQRLEEVI